MGREYIHSNETVQRHADGSRSDVNVFHADPGDRLGKKQPESSGFNVVSVEWTSGNQNLSVQQKMKKTFPIFDE